MELIVWKRSVNPSLRQTETSSIHNTIFITHLYRIFISTEEILVQKVVTVCFLQGKIIVYVLYN